MTTDHKFASQLGVTVPCYRLHTDGRREEFDTTFVVARDSEIPAVIPACRIPCFSPCCTTPEAPVSTDVQEHAAGTCARCGHYAKNGIVRWVAANSGPDARVIIHADPAECRRRT